MMFEWDETKNQNNIAKHGISFEEAKAVFKDSSILTFTDRRFEYGEIRLISIGEILLATQEKAVIVIVVHTQRNQSIRLISARKANAKERTLYVQNN